MVRFGRAAGLAVAGIAIVLGGAFAAPSQAEQAADQALVPYTQHAVTAPVLNASVDQSLNSGLPRAGDAEASLPAPVAIHAVATLEPEAVEAEEPQAEPRTLRQLVADHSNVDVADSELECLAIAVYFESKSEPLAGQLAVAEVVLNRARSGRFPASICGVVKQRGQFSFVRGGQLPSVSRNTAHWRTAAAIAHIAREKLTQSETPTALFFHARRVSPGWRLTRVGIVGNHVFYR